MEVTLHMLICHYHNASMGFLCSGISVVLSYTQGISRCHKTLFLSSPHLLYIIGLIHDFFHW